MGIVATRGIIADGGVPEKFVEAPYPGTEGIGMDGGAWGSPEEGKCVEGCGVEDEWEYVGAGVCVFAYGSLVRCAGGGWGGCGVAYVVGCWGGLMP